MITPRIDVALKVVDSVRKISIARDSIGEIIWVLHTPFPELHSVRLNPIPWNTIKASSKVSEKPEALTIETEKHKSPCRCKCSHECNRTIFSSTR